MRRPLSSFASLVVLLLWCVAWSLAPAEAATQRRAIIVYHHDWGGAAPAAQSELQSRGYTVTVTDDAAKGLQALTQASTSLGAGDYLIVYLAGHGSNPRNSGDTSKATALEHFVQFQNGILKVKQTAPLFEKIAKNGVHLTVIDGSCNGGETVLNAMGQQYCAVATTGVYSPALTDFPYPSNAMHKDSQPSTFGLWWDTPHMTASWMSGEIVIGVPERINQRLFRNDAADLSNLSLFVRPSIGLLTSLDLGGWNLHYLYCYLYRFIYPDDYAALDQSEKGKFTNNVQSYLATIHSSVDPAGPFYTKLNGYLNNDMLLSSAAKTYAARYAQVWRTLATDPTWNISTDPGKYASQMKGLTPDAYQGEAGFLQMAGEIEFLMTILKTGFDQQETLLSEIDAAVKGLYEPAQLPDLTRRIFVKPVWPPEPGQPTIKYNQFERSVIRKVVAIDHQLRVDRRYILNSIQEKPALMRPRALSPQVSKDNAYNAINQGIEIYKGSFKTTISAKVGIASAALNAMKREKLEDLIGKFKAISPTLLYAEGRISFLLSIVEDALTKVQSGGNSPCDQVGF